MNNENNFSAILKFGLGWGILLWLAGYIAGIILFFFLPPNMIGFVLTPLATIITVWVILKKMRGHSMPFYFLTGIVWLLIAITCDYFFIVKVFNPGDGYYKPDVYLYYALTFALPVLVGWRICKRPEAAIKSAR